MTTLREAAEQALESMEAATGYMTDAQYVRLNQSIDALRDALGKLDKTHSDECYQWHHACAIAEILRLRAALKPEPRKSVCVYPQCVSTTRTQCDAWASGACEERS